MAIVRFGPAARRGTCCLGVLVALLSLFPGQCRAEATQPPAAQQHELEVLQADAILDYAAKDCKGAVKKVKKVLDARPDDVPALELLALCQRRLDDDEGALASFHRLFQLAPPSRQPPYRFEVATIYLKRKDYRRARLFFAAAAKEGFNPGMSRFFMGLIDFSEKDWQSARTQFAEALKYDDTRSVAQTARYYLASCNEQLGRTEDAIHGYFSAVYPQADTASGEVRENALKTLKRLNRGQHFEVVSLLQQYNSNVQADPTSVPNPVPPSQRASAESIVNAAVGGVTAPLTTYQAIGSLRLFYNYNWNQVTRNFQFPSVTASGLVLRKPYKPLSFGFKAEGTYTMQNVVDPASTQTSNYSAFSLVGDLGPLARYDLDPETRLVFEATWRPKKFYQDAPTGDARRTGMGYFLRASVEYARSALLDVTGYVSFEEDFPQGSAYVFAAPGAGIADALHLSDKLTVTPTFDFAQYSYFDTSNPERVDTFFSTRVTAQYVLTPHWVLLGDAGYIYNGSTQTATFQYDRTIVTLGASYFF